MSETSIWVIFIAAIFTNNILLTNFLGMCSFIACSSQIKTSLGLGTAVIFVMVMTTIINYAVFHGVLAPLELEHLQFIVFIAVIAAFVQLVEMFVAELPDKIAALEQALTDQDFQTLAIKAHQLKGAAGSYGFPSVSEAAMELEAGAKAQEDLDKLRRHFETLTDLCQRTRAKAVAE